MGIGATFYGYRELGPPALAGRRRLAPPMGLIPPRMKGIEVEMLKIPTYRYATFSDPPTDDYSALIQIGFTTRFIIVTIADGFVDIQYSFDGTTMQDEQTFRTSHREIKAISAFRYRNTHPGNTAQFQLVAML